MKTATKPYLQVSAKGHIVLLISVTPNARESKVAGEHNGRLKIKIHAPPVDGKANEEIIRFLAKKLDIKKNSLQIVKGELGHEKSIAILGLTAIEIDQRLGD